MWKGDFPLVMAYDQWHDPWFMFWFVSASAMGFVLNFSIVHCTKVNSALTTTVIGMFSDGFSSSPILPTSVRTDEPLWLFLH